MQRKYIKLFEERFSDDELELAGMGIESDRVELWKFAKQVSAEILADYAEAFDSPMTSVSRSEFSPDAIYDYLVEWADANELSAEEVIAEFDWRTLLHELGLVNLVHETFADLAEEAETATPPSTAVIKYTNPVSAEITKDESRGKQNVIKFKSGGTTRYYKIVGSVGFKDYDLNFKWIKKEPNGDLQFARYTSGGVDIETIPYSDMATVIKGMNSGSSDINPVTGIHFYKI